MRDADCFWAAPLTVFKELVTLHVDEAFPMSVKSHPWLTNKLLQPDDSWKILSNPASVHDRYSDNHWLSLG